MVAHLYQYHFGKRKGLILHINNGFGEIAPLPGFSKETIDEARAEILAYLHLGAPAALPSVRWGLSCASLPLSNSPLSTPLCALNTPRPGCTTLKLKLGHLKIEEAIAHVRSFIGRYRLRLDCNRSWTLSQALHFASHFSPLDFEYLEEPVDNFPDLLHFSSLTRFPIALDESFRANLPYLDIPTLAAVVIKPTLTGHIPKLPVPTVLSSSYESSLGILQIARHASFTAQGLDTFAQDLLIPPLHVKNGSLVWIPSSNPIDLTKLCLIASVP